MKLYEGLFIFPPDSTPDVRKSQLKNLEDLIAKFKGQVQQKAEWGRKPLGYAIQKFRDGHFLVYDYQMDPAHATEFRKGLDLQEELIKYLIIVKPARVEKKPSSKPVKPAKPAAALSSSTHSKPVIKPSSPAQPANA